VTEPQSSCGPRVAGWLVRACIIGSFIAWTCVVLALDAILGWALYQQFRAATFPTADGIIIRNEVKTTEEDGTTHRPDVAYAYSVEGVRYTGTRYSTGEMGENSQAWHRVRDGLPVGTPVKVAYNPDDPVESLLRPGMTGFHLLMVWFLTPFNVLMIAVWVALRRPRRPEFDPADPRSVKQTATGYCVRLPGSGRAGCFGVVLAAVTFAGGFAWAVGWGFYPPVEFAAPAYVTAIALALMVAVRFPRPRLEVDEAARVLKLPAEVPFDTIRAVVATREETRDSNGDVTAEHHCDLVRTDGSVVRAATFEEAAPAEALAAWLRERVGLAAPSAGVP
jgi:hypothetical protein